jgi:MFS family permease
MAVAQFLGAFNDNVTKQLAMLVCLTETKTDKQALATAVFAVPFLMFSGTAGFLADRMSKSWIVQACKMAEVAIQGLGLLLAIVVGMQGGSLAYALLAVLFFMGAHSAFFGPSKYGILPELISKDDLPKANGVFLATTFLAIILGWVAAGYLLGETKAPPEEENTAVQAEGEGNRPMSRRVAFACTAGMAFAVMGWVAARMLRKTPPAKPDLEYSPKQLAVDPATWSVVGRDKLLLGVLTVNGTFFLCGGVMHPAVNAFGMQQLHTSSMGASQLLACVAFGIAAGCAVAGKWCGPRARLQVSKIGAATIAVFLILLGLIPRPTEMQTMWVAASAVLLFGVGFGAGLLAVPLQVVMQIRPPAEHKGRVFAVLSVLNWIGVLLSAAFYQGCLAVRTAFSLPPSFVFFAVASLMAAVAILLPPRVVEGRSND